MLKLSKISFPFLDHIHGGFLVFRRGESTEQYPHTGCFVSTQRYPPEGFVATEGSTPEASSTVQVLDWWLLIDGTLHFEIPIELCKAALSMLLQWHDLKLFCILPMQWYDLKDPTGEYDMQSCIIYPEWKAAFKPLRIESWNFYLKTCTNAYWHRLSQRKFYLMAALIASPNINSQEGYQPCIVCSARIKVVRSPGFLIKRWLICDKNIRWVTLFVVSFRITLP